MTGDERLPAGAKQVTVGGKADEVERCTCGGSVCESALCDCDAIPCPVNHLAEAAEVRGDALKAKSAEHERAEKAEATIERVRALIQRERQRAYDSDAGVRDLVDRFDLNDLSAALDAPHTPADAERTDR